MHATIMNGSNIGSGSIIGAKALVTTDMEIAKYSLVLGIPGKIIKQDESFREMAQKNAKTYQQISKEHLEGKHSTYSGKD
jgi:carbonic anhydrase/acetyltransferase-like protein (isoleucine patch superfamily)